MGTGLDVYGRQIVSAAQYSLLALALAMITDNAIVYGFVMMPLAITLGTAAGVVFQNRSQRVVEARDGT